MSQLAHLRRDLRRYKPYEWLTEPSVWALVVYRLGRAATSLPAPLRPPATILYVVARLLTRIASQIDLPRSVDVGPGLRIHHGGPIVFSADVVVGADCDIGHGVTLGTREDGRVPTIGDRVVLSAYAQVLGPVHVGNDTKIGAMAVVIDDLPAGVTAAGIPARVLSQRA